MLDIKITKNEALLPSFDGRWYQYIRNKNSSESFIIPFFGILDEVFCELISYTSPVETSFISEHFLENMVFHDLGNQLFLLSRSLFISEFKMLKKSRIVNDKKIFQSFLKKISEPSYISELFLKYPSFKNVVKNYKNVFLSFYKEVLDHYINDYYKICEAFFDHSSIKLFEIERMGDIHEHGRSVCLLKFLNQNNEILRLVYKPKNLLSDKLYNHVLKWCADALGIKLNAANYLYRKDYGWMEFVEQGFFENERDLKEYFYKFGVVLMVAYLLLGKDFHAHNVVATHNGPILIDLECIMTPFLEGISKTDKFLLLNTMLIPQKRIIGGVDFDISALSNVSDKYHISEEYIFKNDSNDDIELISQKRMIPKARNLPIFSGIEVECFAYMSEIESGFVDCYKLINGNKEWLINSSLSPLAGAKNIKVRVVFRNTNEYNQYMQKGYLNQLTEDFSAWEKYFSEFKNNDIYSYSDEIANYESAMLKKGIIPTFWAKTNSDKIKTPLGVVMFKLSRFPYSRFSEHIKSFSEEDLHRQLNLLSQSILAYQLNQSKNINVNDELNRNVHNARQNDVENLVKNTLYRLFDLAFLETNRIYWTYIHQTQHDQFLIDKTNATLPSGSLGILLILALLADAYQASDLLAEIKKIWFMIFPFIESELRSSFCMGFSGIGGQLYAADRISKLVGVPSKLDSYYSETIKKVKFNESNFNYFAGVTGFLCSLISTRAHLLNEGFLQNQLSMLQRSVTNQINDSETTMNFFYGLSAPVYVLERFANQYLIDQNMIICLLEKFRKGSSTDSCSSFLLGIALLYDLPMNKGPLKNWTNLDDLLSDLTNLSVISPPIFSDTYQILEKNGQLSSKIFSKMKDEFIASNVQTLSSVRSMKALSPGYLTGMAGVLYALAQLTLDLKFEKITIMGIDK